MVDVLRRGDDQKETKGNTKQKKDLKGGERAIVWEIMVRQCKGREEIYGSINITPFCHFSLLLTFVVIKKEWHV